MKIQRLHINHFGKLKNCTIKFGDGIHVISGENESGKSTLHAFIKAMLFGIERSRGRGAKTDTYSRYLPWEGSSSYGGVLELMKEDTHYSIYRNFEKKMQPCNLVDETHARELSPSQDNFSFLLSGLTPSLYTNTLSIGQLKSVTQEDLAEELRNHIVNLHTSGSQNLDVFQAIAQLKLEKKRQIGHYSKEADQEDQELSWRIQTLESDLENLQTVNEIPQIEKEKARLEREILRLGDRHKQFTGVIARAEEFLEKHSVTGEAEMNEVLARAEALEREYEDYSIYYKKPLDGAFRSLFAILSVILCVAGLFGFWQSAMQLLQKDYLHAFLYLLVTMLAGTFALRVSRQREADAYYRMLCKEFASIYKKYWGQVPEEMNHDAFQLLKQRLIKCEDLYQTVYLSQAAINSDVESLLSVQNHLSEVTARLEAAIKESWQIEQKEEALLALEERKEMLRETIEQNRKIEEESAAITLAINTMQELSSTVFDSFGFFLEEKASQLIAGITAGTYTRLYIDDDLNITLEQNYKKTVINQVSSGTIDQVYLALRLACIEFLWPDQSMPLLLDDSFSLYDGERLTSTLQWLSENYSGQIFLFTCHQREEEILTAQHIPYQKIHL